MAVEYGGVDRYPLKTTVVHFNPTNKTLMETSEKIFINENLPNLIQLTNCNESLLAYLKSKEVISDSDEQEIKSKGSTFPSSSHLYEIIQTRSNAFEHLIGALTFTKQSGARNILLNHKEAQLLSRTNLVPKNSKKIHFGVRAPAPLFTGRLSEIKLLHLYLTNNVDETEGPEERSKIISISGLGGIGKTELVRQYIHTYHKFYLSIVWINAEKEFIMKSNFQNLAKDELQIKTRDANEGEKEIESILGLVYQHFQESKNLFIFDNVENAEYLSKYLPFNNIVGQKNTFPSIILTSRSRNLTTKGAQVLDLQELKEEEAKEFVRKGLELTDSNDIDEIEHLIRKLQCFPLALQEAIAYINTENEFDDYSISSFLKDYDNIKLDVLDSHVSLELHNIYKGTMYNIVKMTLQKIESDARLGELGMQIIKCMAYMSDSVPRIIFFPLSTDQGKVKGAVRLLVKCAIVTGDRKHSILRVHRVVQELIRLHLHGEGTEEDIISQSLELLTFDSNLSNQEIMLEQLISVWSYAKQYDAVISKFCHTPIRIVDGLFQCVRYVDALRLGKDDMARLINLLGEDKIEVLDLRQAICRVLYGLGKYTEALKELEELLILKKRLYGEEHPFTLDIIHDTGRILIQQAEYETACHMFEDVYKRRKIIYGPENVKTIDSRHNMGICKLELGSYNEALFIYQEAEKNYEKLFDSESEPVLSTSQNIAVLMGNMGRYKQAVEILRSLFEKITGNNEIWRTRVQQNLAYYLHLQGNLQDAHELADSAFMKFRSILGPDHPETLRSESNLGIIKRKLGRFEESINLQNKVYHKLVENFGNDSTRTLLVKSEVALLWGHQDLFEVCFHTVPNIIATLENRRPRFSHNIIRLKIEYASVLEYHKKFDGALKYYIETHDQIKETFGEEHEDLLRLREKIEELNNVCSTII